MSIVSSNPMTGALGTVTSTANAAASFVSGRIAAADGRASSALSSLTSFLNALRASTAMPTGMTVRNPNLIFNVSKLSSLYSENINWPTLSASSLGSVPVPTMDPLESLPSFSSLLGSVDVAKNTILAKVISLVTSSSTGLDPSVEQAIWDRALYRQELKNLEQYNEAEKYFSSRGFDLPTGALAGRLQQVSIEIARTNAGLNTDIMIEQAKLEQTNMHFILEKAAALVVELINAGINAVLKKNQALIDKFKASMDGYIGKIQAQVALMELQVKEFTARAEIAKVKADVAGVESNANLKKAQLDLEYVKAQAELALEASKAQVDYNVRAFGVQVEAARGGAQAAAQVVAGILSTVSTSCNYGFTGSASAIGSGTDSWSFATVNSHSTVTQSSVGI